MSTSTNDHQRTPHYVYKVNIEATYTDKSEKQPRHLVQKVLENFFSLAQANSFARQCVLFGRRSRDFVPNFEEITDGEKITSMLKQDKDLPYHGGQIEDTRSKYNEDGFLHYTAWIGGNSNGPQRAGSKPLRPKRVDAWVERVPLTDLSMPMTPETLDNWHRFMPSWIPRQSSTHPQSTQSTKRRINEKDQGSSESTNYGELTPVPKRQKRQNANDTPHKPSTQISSTASDITQPMPATCNRDGPHNGVKLNEKPRTIDEREIEILFERRLAEEKEKWEKVHLASMKLVLAKEKSAWEKAHSERDISENERLKGIIKKNVEFRMGQEEEKLKKQFEESHKLKLENEREQWKQEQKTIEQRRREGFRAFVDKRVEERLEKEKEKWLQQELETVRSALAKNPPPSVEEPHMSNSVEKRTKQFERNPRTDDVRCKPEQIDLKPVIERNSSHLSVTPSFECGFSPEFRSIVPRPSVGCSTPEVDSSIEQQLSTHYIQASRSLSRTTEMTAESDSVNMNCGTTCWPQNLNRHGKQTGGTPQIPVMQGEPKSSAIHSLSVADIRNLHERSTRSFLIALAAYEEQTQMLRSQQQSLGAQQQLFEKNKAELWSEKEQLKQAQEGVLRQIADATNLDFQLKTEAEELKEQQRRFNEERNAFENEQLLSKKKDEELFLEFQATMAKHGFETFE